MKFLEFTFQSFWHFLGVFLLIAGFLNFIYTMWSCFWKNMNVRKHGYPPDYCHADGTLDDLM